eukprot:TRINITY_DN22371_c0_g1_i1.p1 TRINITY_DN22371_c0_g1~~TRINITY_DN22371_c0_g1_i1.p1  ORF type:complete len:1381 (+),score=219.86 TRINITY_DN22371_c0_g1_i1:125-4267(+)
MDPAPWGMSGFGGSRVGGGRVPATANSWMGQPGGQGPAAALAASLFGGSAQRAFGEGIGIGGGGGAGASGGQKNHAGHDVAMSTGGYAATATFGASSSPLVEGAGGGAAVGVAKAPRVSGNNGNSPRRRGVEPGSSSAVTAATGCGGLVVAGNVPAVGVGEVDLVEHFGVVIRVRPALERELVSPVWQNVISVNSKTELCLHEVIPEASGCGGGGDRSNPGAAQIMTTHPFTFDHVYSSESSQPSVYATTARASVLSALQGYNASVIAYGPTGTGKTYTMEGPGLRVFDGESDRAGIIPRSMDEIFQHIRHCRGPQSRFLVRASYLQIYNEVISDLLKPDRTHLMIREDRRRGVFVDGLSEWLCKSPSEVQTLMERGSAGRATAHTASNDASSRSHAVFIVIVEQSETFNDGGHENVGADGNDQAGASSLRQRVRVGRLNLVDLAGSERPRITGAVGQRLEETKKINQSLSALGNVISALTERRSRQHIPYRDSKLTRLLEDSLGGNCRTTMMAMVSPAAEAFSESLSTLKFAHRAKAIRNTPQVNEDVDQRTLLRRYEAELKQLRADLRERNRNVVDKRQLLEIEEERRRAEEDRAAALSALEERSQILEQEKAEKRQLEERISAMSSQMLVGGQHERIHSEYATRLAELERERSTIEEDKAQVGRYKQLLLKQRDIMIALTQRLHERDETIIGLQDDMDARDQRVAELEEHLDQRNAQLLAVERQAVGGGSSGVEAKCFLNTPAGGNAPPVNPRYPPENAVFDVRGDRPTQLLSAEEKVAELSALLDIQRQENHRLTLELDENRHAVGSAERGVASSGLFDRISESLLEVTGPPMVRLKLTQDIMALKRLSASWAGTTSTATSKTPPFGTPNSVTDTLMREAVGGHSSFPNPALLASAIASRGRSDKTSGGASTDEVVTLHRHAGAGTDLADVPSLATGRHASSPSAPPARGEGYTTPKSEGSVGNSSPRGSNPQTSRGRRTASHDRGAGNSGAAARPRSQPSSTRSGNDRPLTVRRSNGSSVMTTSGGGGSGIGGSGVSGGGSTGSARAASVNSGGSTTAGSQSGIVSTSLKSNAFAARLTHSGTAAAAAATASNASVATMGSASPPPEWQQDATTAFGINQINVHGTHPSACSDSLPGGSTAGFPNGFGSGPNMGVFGTNHNTGSANGFRRSASLGRPPSGAGGNSAVGSFGRGPVRATPLPGPAVVAAAGGSVAEGSSSSASVPATTGGASAAMLPPRSWRSSGAWQPPASAASIGGLPPATAAAMASAAAAAASRAGTAFAAASTGTVDASGCGLSQQLALPASCGGGGWPPFSGAATPPASVGSPFASGVGCGSSGGGDAVGALREEAQRSVDALLARRRAELQRRVASPTAA